MIDLVGWIATAVFVGSYFFSRAEVMRRMQMVGALIWIVYGVLLPAPPVIAANLLVAGAAAWTARRAAITRRGGGPGAAQPGAVDHAVDQASA